MLLHGGAIPHPEGAARGWVAAGGWRGRAHALHVWRWHALEQLTLRIARGSGWHLHASRVLAEGLHSAAHGAVLWG